MAAPRVRRRRRCGRLVARIALVCPSAGGLTRHLVGGAIVGVAWIVFFGGFIAVVLLRPT
jgi:hypothetical protein